MGAPGRRGTTSFFQTIVNILLPLPMLEPEESKIILKSDAARRDNPCTCNRWRTDVDATVTVRNLCARTCYEKGELGSQKLGHRLLNALLGMGFAACDDRMVPKIGPSGSLAVLMESGDV